MKYLILSLLALELGGCASALPTHNLSLGMNKAQVMQTLGKSGGVISSEQLDNHTREVVEYRRDGLWWGDLDDTYWFYFTDDKLEKWGRPGDHLRHIE